MMLSFWTSLPISTALAPYICLNQFRGADWDAHASHAGDRNDIGRRVKNVKQASKGWVLVQLLTDERGPVTGLLIKLTLAYTVWRDEKKIGHLT